MKPKTFIYTLCLMSLPLAAMAEQAERIQPDMLPQQWAPDSVFMGGVSLDNTDWWNTFEDPVLNKLISLGEEANYNAVTALRRIDIARAELGKARSGWYPQLDLNAGYERTRTSGRMAGSKGSASTLGYFNGDVSVNWEIDLFGKVREQVKQAKAEVKLNSAEYSAAINALDAEIATAYINLVVGKLQLEVATRHGQNQKQILNVAETRHRTGLVSELDVAQARTLYYSTIASVPKLEASIDASYNAIAVLLGTTREGLPSELFTSDSLPNHYQLAGLGAPLDLLRRRPDIVAAERSIEVAAAALGIAKKDYLPSLSISASVGTAAHRFGDLFSGPSFTYSVAPTLSWTIFDGLARRNSTTAARLELENAVDSYNLTVLTAIEEVRNNITSYKASIEYIERIEKVVESSEEAVTLSFDLYKQGLTVFSNVVDAQLNYLTYQNTLVAARGDALNTLIALYKALGGGWRE